MAKPSFRSHLIALVMPVTMSVIIPSWLLMNHEPSPANIIERASGILLLILGLILFAWTLQLFINVGKGTLAPWNETKHLIATGPYKYCRNPMISGVLFIILGETLFFNSVTLLLWGLAFFAVNTTYFILVEEPGLSRKFGKSYDNYKQHVHRWLPSLRPYSQ